MSLENAISRAKERKDLEEILDVEGFASFEDFITSVTSAVVEAFDWLRNYHKYADIITPAPIGSSIRSLEKIGYTGLAEVNIYLPPYCKTDMLSYFTELQRQISAIADLTDRVYIPVREHLEFAVGLENHHNKPFADRRYKKVDVEKLRRDFLKVNEPFDKEDQDELNMVSEVTHFKNAFRSLKAVQQAEKQILDIGKQISVVNLDYLKKEETRILEALQTLMSQIAEGEKEDFGKGAKRQLATLLTDIAIETEYLSVMLFTANVTIEAWNKTVEKLKKL